MVRRRAASCPIPSFPVPYSSIWNRPPSASIRWRVPCTRSRRGLSSTPAEMTIAVVRKSANSSSSRARSAVTLAEEAMRVPVNVHQGFLNDPEHGRFERSSAIIEKVAGRFEGDPMRCSPAEVAA